jgi:hypothetical protein
MAEERVSIDLTELRSALARMLDAASRTFGPTVDLAADHYWLIELADAFDLDREPTVNTGQLSDDVESIREFLSRPDGDTYLWHDLQWRPPAFVDRWWLGDQAAFWFSVS